MSIARYYSTLICHWQQLDIFKEHDWNCPKDGIKYMKIIEQRRIFKFEGVGIEASTKYPRRFLRICREESQKKVMMASQNVTPTIENSALAALGIEHHSNDN